MTRIETSITREALNARVLCDQADLLQANVPGNMAGSTSAALVAAWMLSDGLPSAAIAWWIAAQLVLSALALVAAWRVHLRPTTQRNAARRVSAAARGSLLFGLLWSAGVFLLWQPGQFERQVLLMFLIAGLTSGALHAQMASHKAFLAFFVPCLLSVLICAALNPGMHTWAIMVSVLVYALASSRVAVLMHATLIDSLRRRHEIEALASDLKLQKERAEAANSSKSRFFAAASHDLRQPVHALALFAAALSHRPLEPEAARLSALMGSTVDAMGRMFNGLLDVSRLDAGALRAEPCAFDLRPLLGRIVADERASALAKGLDLRLRCGDLAVQTDPLLLERIVRNLVVNAVRYTERGGVLVAAQSRDHEVILRVIDTGVGIAPESQEAVFSEFVQLHNPERDQTRGLGLGLAIVRRLAELLSIELRLKSHPGRGTTVALRLARATTASKDHASATEPLPTFAVNGGELVLVIDDDAASRAAMESLLQAWGYNTLGAEGLADLSPRLMQLHQVPVLLISDLRLRGAQRGTDVVAQLREWFNDALPALIVTGDTDPQRLQEVQAAGLQLLRKPVTQAELRAAMAQAIANGTVSDGRI